MNKKHIIVTIILVIAAFTAGHYLGGDTNNAKEQVSSQVSNEAIQADSEKKLPVIESVWTPSPEIDPDAQNHGDENNSESIQENNELVKPKNQQVYYKQYTNDRYWFSIEYPSIFITKPLPDNGDGIGLSTTDENTELTIAGINNVLNETTVSIYNDLLKEHRNASYKKHEDNWMVVSWLEGDKIVYEKRVVGNGSINTFIIKYPSNQNDYYSPIISHLNSTFDTPQIDTGH
ncbi:hypothetical protein [Clostridium sp.]